MTINLIYGLSHKLLTAHISLTIFQNTPDTLVPSLQGYSPGWDIPQWRFFAPSPGVSNYHILYRTRDIESESWSGWRELEVEQKSTILSFLWNPSSRYTKANFDLANAISNLVSYGATFDFIKKNDIYTTISRMIDNRCDKYENEEYQFLIATSTPNIKNVDVYSFEPKLFSDIHKVSR